MKGIFPIIIYIVFTTIFFSCRNEIFIPGSIREEPVSPEKLWSIFVYMNGDNDLESQALKDLNEMEAALSQSDQNIEIIVLIDRSSLYDSADGDWSGTRLYRVRGDSGGLNYNIISERLSCSDLGITADSDGELNLGTSSVLSTFLSFSMENYKSDQNMLIIWGHGSGWRGPGGYSSSGYKGVSFDDGDSDFLYTSELGDALEGQSIDILSFDTCSSMLIEVAYVVRHSAGFMVGSEDVVSAEGWDYESIISSLSESDGTVASANSALIAAFQEDYHSSSGATLSVLDLSKVENIVTELNNFVSRRELEAASSADSNIYYTDLKTQIMDDVEDFYTTPGDLNIDIAHLAQIIEGDGSDLKAAVEDAVSFSFNSTAGNPNAKGLALHFVPLQESGMLAVHDDAYFIDRISGYQLDFVGNSLWCPNESLGSGLLWNLFY